MASSSSSAPDVAPKLEELVQRCCPELRERVQHWLSVYRDPDFLYESLRREYGEGRDDSDEELRGKTRLCEAHLLERCHRGSACRYAHGEEELRRKRPRRQPLGGCSVLHLLPSDIRFCHDTVAPEFQDGRPILATVLGLSSGEVSLRQLPEMEVVFFEDRLYSLSNRRLCLYMLCEHLGLIDKKVPVRVKLLEKLPASFCKKFTTMCNGDWVRVRRDGRICARSFERTSFGRELLQ